MDIYSFILLLGSYVKEVVYVKYQLWYYLHCKHAAYPHFVNINYRCGDCHTHCHYNDV